MAGSELTPPRHLGLPPAHSLRKPKPPKPITTTHTKDDRSSAVKAFLAAVEEVCQKHNLSLGHEDHHGAFEVYTYDENAARWLADAHEVVTHPAEA